MKAVFLNDAFHSSYADGPPVLIESLCNNLGRSVMIQKSVAYDLPDDCGGGAIICFRATGLAFQHGSASLQESGAQLIVALPGESKFFGGVGFVFGFALSFNQHDDFTGNFVILMKSEHSVFSDEGVKGGLKVCHGASPVAVLLSIHHGCAECLIKYGGACNGMNADDMPMVIYFGIFSALCFSESGIYRHILLDIADGCNPNSLRI